MILQDRCFWLARQRTSSLLQVKNTYAKCWTQTFIHYENIQEWFSWQKSRKKTSSLWSLTDPVVIKLASTHFYILKKAFLLNIPDSLVDELINQVDNAG